MNRTNYVNKAKRLLHDTARASALVIVPLAAASLAQATVVAVGGLPTGNVTCSTPGFYQGCSGGGSLISHGNGLGGVALSTASAVNIGFTSGGAYNFAISLSAYGPFSRQLPTSIPVDWDFTIAVPDGIQVPNWSLSFSLSDKATGNSDLGMVTETGSGTGEFTGVDTLNLVSGSPANLYETAVLTVGTSGIGNGYIVANVLSSGSFDFNGAPANTSAPEPASIGLLGTGIAFLGALLRRRRRKA